MVDGCRAWGRHDATRRRRQPAMHSMHSMHARHGCRRHVAASRHVPAACTCPGQTPCSGLGFAGGGATRLRLACGLCTAQGAPGGGAGVCAVRAVCALCTLCVRRREGGGVGRQGAGACLPACLRACLPVCSTLRTCLAALCCSTGICGSWRHRVPSSARYLAAPRTSLSRCRCPIDWLELCGCRPNCCPSWAGVCASTSKQVSATRVQLQCSRGMQTFYAASLPCGRRTAGRLAGGVVHRCRSALQHAAMPPLPRMHRGVTSPPPVARGPPALQPPHPLSRPPPNP